MGKVMCPHCGVLFECRRLKHGRLIPTHDYPKPCRAVCPGTHQNPRNPETDKRPLWSEAEAEPATEV